MVGSPAARIQSSMGNVPAGSLFADAQRVSMSAQIAAFIKVVFKGVILLSKMIVVALLVYTLLLGASCPSNQTCM